MRGHRAVDAGFVGNALEDALNGMGRHADGVMDGKVSVDEWAYPVGEGDNAALGLRAVDAAFAVDHEPVVLPVDLIAGEACEFGHS